MIAYDKNIKESRCAVLKNRYETFCAIDLKPGGLSDSCLRATSCLERGCKKNHRSRNYRARDDASQSARAFRCQEPRSTRDNAFFSRSPRFAGGLYATGLSSLAPKSFINSRKVDFYTHTHSKLLIKDRFFFFLLK